MKNSIIYLLFLIPILLLTTDCEKEEIQPTLHQNAAIESLEAYHNTPDATHMIGKEVHSLTDFRDGQHYRVVEINHKYWMADNLNFETDESWWYNNNPDLGERFGRLYTWDAAKEACPPGWRLPTDEEWSEMIRYFDPDFEYYSTTAIRDLYYSYEESEFDAMPGGQVNELGYFSYLGAHGTYWSSTLMDTEDAFCYGFMDTSGGGMVTKYFSSTGNGYSCRCIKD